LSGVAAPRFLSVVGARPNFMKLAPLARALARRGGVGHVVVHTGQHYDPDMSDAFFRDLALAPPAHHLGVGSGSHAHQTAAVMQRLEPVCLAERPDVMLVYGDVNSTMAAALVAAKLGIRVAHVEAGLRSGDRTMPEEINRVVTDHVADLLFAPSPDAVVNLRAEGVPAGRIHFVGNVMIDALVALLPAARAAAPAETAPYAVVTLHRPANVDDPAVLAELLAALTDLARERRIVFPVHPRTRGRLAALGWRPPPGAGLVLREPVSYLEMLRLVLGSALVITDSGGLQEETTFLGIPCLTVRPTTERPLTCTLGTNRLVPARRDAVREAACAAWGRRRDPAPVIARWDGRAAERIAAVLCDGAAPD
jgi:UDP-N-acetylglucosamine 2-epimerase (non-hydrolysing)